MRSNFILALLLFVCVGIAALIARNYGFYNDYWFTDVILHIVSGFALGLTWIGLNRGEVKRRWMVILCAVSFAALGSVLWEFWEFSGWRITPSHTRFYIPELGDSLLDILCGLLGGAISGLKKN
jgi:hypothetical protein